MSMDIKAYMICHTHWDREWYLTREEFRTKLVRLIDGLLEIIDTTPEYVSFMLDGQTIIIEDYLEIKPYNRKKLFDALRSGKIICGPWYILPDELLVSAESHIRNYIKGTEVVKDAGRKMETAYLPDSFGHPAQMPQIVAGLGMKAMVFWRGVSNEITQSEFIWRSPFEGSEIFCVHLPYGYGNMANLSGNMEEAVPRIQKMVDQLCERTETGIVLLMNGSDHIIGQKDICDVVKKVNERLQGCEIELSTLEGYLDEVRSRTGVLPVVTGEFRSGERSMLLGGTLSARMYLKQKNSVVQDKMERYLEPMLAIEKLCGGTMDSKGYRDYIWKKILENHPHDSICGCSVDAVHREMITRYDSVEQLENMMMRDAVVRAGIVSRERQPERMVTMFLFEPTARSLPSYVETDIYLDEELVQEVCFAKSIIMDYENQIVHPKMPDGIRITDELGREISHVILDAQKDYVTHYQDCTAPEIFKVNKIRVGLLLPEFSYGCHQLFVTPTDMASERIRHTEEQAVENEYYRLSVVKGNLVLLDKKTKKVYDGFAKLIDKGDAGDEYTYSWPLRDCVYTVSGETLHVECERKSDIAQSLIIKGNMMLPEALTQDRKGRSEKLTACPFLMKFTVCRGINRIDCHMEFDNKAKDHRLQVQFPSGIRTDSCESFDIFNLTRRKIKTEVPEEWMEFPQSTHPTHGYIGVHDEVSGMSVGVSGLTEYEAVTLEEEAAINVTLLRCVGWLSRTDLMTRHGNGGWTIETEEAQCIGKHVWDFSVTYHKNNTEEAFGIIEKFRYPSYIYQMQKQGRDGWMTAQVADMMGALPGGIEISAFKPSEDDRGVVLRIYSLAEKHVRFDLPVPESVKRVCIADLAERVQTEMERNDGKIQLEICPGQIVTLYMEL